MNSPYVLAILVGSEDEPYHNPPLDHLRPSNWKTNENVVCI